MKRGDFVWIELEGRGLRGMVVFASANEMSIAVMFEGMLGGYVGMMPLLKDQQGVYRDLFEDRAVTVTREGRWVN